MNVRSLHSKDRSFRKALRPAALTALVLLVGACSKGEGVQLGTGQSPDPVVVDFPIAYITRPVLFDVDGNLLTSEVRRAVEFRPGAELFYGTGLLRVRLKHH